ncbi:LysM peptidoglycan-binding domain-containing protein [Streptomyces actinomycinicus]|uniref:LysM peptidoglycan-binding domain-containing protein n=1 Tax=Streptomyces actinomycinicus TaxID=1695166 RepID=A0A937EGU0_9ACTN|nr:transglycosylase family protein [Streptomyces actinomycinicus]MBL1082127.1 LysM peptidoglycan-binding domain-containing protein [Streptomyces actinomycinicus]
MLSGNGRHRRPRQAPALLVAAGVTGSAIAIPLLGAASANAADGTTWDKVAECESGGSWSADPGNGYYGGLQISQADWAAYGGTQYAASADQASRSQQIAVAEKILADKGTAPWATCALLSGLTSDSGSADVDTGVGGSGDTDGSGDTSGSTGSSDDSGNSDSSDSSGLPDSSHSDDAGSDGNSGSGAGSSSGKDAGPAGKPGAGHGEHDGEAAGSGGTDTPKSDKSVSPEPGSTQGADDSATVAPEPGREDNPQQAAGSWSLVDTGTLGGGGRHRGASADESAASGQGAASGRHASREPGTYTVRDGDSLASIADSLEVDGGWRALYAGNKKAIGADPNHITAGQTLEVGDETDVD